MNRNIIVTGASRGIGKAIALAFAACNDHLFLTCRTRTNELSAVRDEALKKGALSVTLFSGDLSDEKNCDALFDAFEKSYRHLDILVNNAAVDTFSLFQDASDEDTRCVLSANLLAPMRLIKKAVPMMLSRHEGRIINISSVFGVYGASMEADYSAAKGGLNALTRSLGKELAPSGIAVNALALGAVDTEMNIRLSDEERQALEDEIPFGRMASPSEAAEMVRIIAEAPYYLTGQVIEFSGGWF